MKNKWTDSVVKPTDYIYLVKSFSNYDGDTINTLVERTFDAGFGHWLHSVQPINVRLYGVDTPELRGGTTQTKAAGYLAKEFVANWMEDAINNCILMFNSLEFKKGKFGRALGDFYRVDQPQTLTELLLEKRLAVRYLGESKEKVKAQHAENLQYLIDTNQIEAE